MSAQKGCVLSIGYLQACICALHLSTCHAEANHHQITEQCALIVSSTCVSTCCRLPRRLHGLHTGISIGWLRLLGSCVDSKKRSTNCSWRKIRMSRCSVCLADRTLNGPVVRASSRQAGDQGSNPGRAVFPVQPRVRLFGERIGILLVSSNRMG